MGDTGTVEVEAWWATVVAQNRLVDTSALQGSGQTHRTLWGEHFLSIVPINVQ